MNDVEDRLRGFGDSMTLDRGVSDVVARGTALSRKRRVSAVASSAALGLVVVAGAVGVHNMGSQASIDPSSGVPSGIPDGWGPRAINVSPIVLAAARDTCRSVRESEPLDGPPLAATSIGNGVDLLIYRSNDLVWNCEVITTGAASGAGGGSNPISASPLGADKPLADTCSTTVASAMVTGTTPGDRGKYPGDYLVWGRVSPDVDGVVVAVDGDRVKAGLAGGIFFALVPTNTQLDSISTPLPTISSTAYSASGDVLGHDTEGVNCVD